MFSIFLFYIIILMKSFVNVKKKYTHDWKFYQITSLYIIKHIYLASWSYIEHFSIIFWCFGIDRYYSQSERWTEFCVQNVTNPFKYEKHMIRMRRMDHVFQHRKWLELTWFARFYLIFSLLGSILLLSYFSKKFFFYLCKQSLKLSLLS